MGATGGEDREGLALAWEPGDAPGRRRHRIVPRWHGDELGPHKLPVVAFEDRLGQLGSTSSERETGLIGWSSLAANADAANAVTSTTIATSTNGNALRDALDARRG